VVRLYGTVEYFDSVFQDAELIGRVWHYEGVKGELVPFLSQQGVDVLAGPHRERRVTRIVRRSQMDAL
jgi:hypothetical protein